MFKYKNKKYSKFTSFALVMVMAVTSLSFITATPSVSAAEPSRTLFKECYDNHSLGSSAFHECLVRIQCGEGNTGVTECRNRVGDGLRMCRTQPSTSPSAPGQTRTEEERQAAMRNCEAAVLQSGRSTTTYGVGANEARSDCNQRPLNANNCEIVRYIVLLTRTLSAVVGVVVVIMIAVGGVQYSSSRDNPQATQEAKNKIRNAILALVMYLFIFAFLQWLIPGGVF